MQPKIFCVIPAYNEENSIIEAISKAKKYVDRVVVVDDGSTDKTFGLAKEQDAVVLRHVINRGQGASLATGNEYAIKKGADVVVHFDADGQFVAGEIEDMIRPILEDGYDMVFGSRFLNIKSSIPWSKKYIIFPLANLFNNIFLKVSLSDPQNGFRALNRNALKKIKIENDGSAHCSEILHKAFKEELKITEVPVTVIYNDFGQGILSGKGRGAGGLRVIKDLILGKLIN